MRHIPSMAEECFPLGTQYKVVSLKDGTLGVEVSIPGKRSYTVDSFDTEGEANNWILSEQQKTAEANPGRG
jgi:hypothetical protein